MRYYISIEKNIEGFEFFKTLWQGRGIQGLMADNMTEGIQKAIELEKSKYDELYFIDIVADDINYLSQLKILTDETNAPILIATSNYNDEEHHEALGNGADFYGGYCETPEQNIYAVNKVIESIARRARKKKPSSRVIICGGIMIARAYRQVFVNNILVDLNKKEYEILNYLMINQGQILTHTQILRKVWGDDYSDNGME